MELNKDDLLMMRKKMPQKTREVLNVLLGTGYDITDFVFCSKRLSIESIKYLKECDNYECNRV